MHFSPHCLFGSCKPQRTYHWSVMEIISLSLDLWFSGEYLRLALGYRFIFWFPPRPLPFNMSHCNGMFQGNHSPHLQPLSGTRFQGMPVLKLMGLMALLGLLLPKIVFPEHFIPSKVLSSHKHSWRFLSFYTLYDSEKNIRWSIVKNWFHTLILDIGSKNLWQTRWREKSVT